MRRPIISSAAFRKLALDEQQLMVLRAVGYFDFSRHGRMGRIARHPERPGGRHCSVPRVPGHLHGDAVRIAAEYARQRRLIVDIHYGGRSQSWAVAFRSGENNVALGDGGGQFLGDAVAVAVLRANAKLEGWGVR